MVDTVKPMPETKSDTFDPETYFAVVNVYVDKWKPSLTGSLWSVWDKAKRLTERHEDIFNRYPDSSAQVAVFVDGQPIYTRGEPPEGESWEQFWRDSF